MGTPAPDAAKGLVDRFDLGRKVFLSGDYEEEPLSMAGTPPEQESTSARLPPLTSRLTSWWMSCTGLKEEEIRIVEGEAR
jgi:hypothetical protein